MENEPYEIPESAAPRNEIKKNHDRILWMTRTAILAAIIILLELSRIGLIRFGTIEITILMIPVVVGAILIGPASGAVLGVVFGLVSFSECFGISPFGTTLMGINPIFTFILCLVPRVLMGWLAGIIFQALYKVDKTKFISFVVVSLSGALLNTVLFVGGLILFFGNSDYIRSFGPNLPAILAVLITINAVVEAIVCTVVGTAVTKPLYKIVHK